MYFTSHELFHPIMLYNEVACMMITDIAIDTLGWGLLVPLNFSKLLQIH